VRETSAAPGSERARLGFVLCPSYHGATLLSLMLNNHSAVSALGDTNPSRKREQVCTCLKPVSECEFWEAVCARIESERFAALDTLLPTLPWPLTDHYLDGGLTHFFSRTEVNRFAGRCAAGVADLLLPIIWRRRSQVTSEYVQTWQSFYAAVRELYGTSLMIDGTKSARKAALWASTMGADADIKVIHLVRDPRGYSASMRRREGHSDIRRYAWQWANIHERIEHLNPALPYVRIRYEDLATRPEETIGLILDFLGLEREPVLGPPRFPHKHHLIGNSMRLQYDGRVVLDQRWREELTATDQRQVLRCAGRVAAMCEYA
jgi:hypothetical protein